MQLISVFLKRLFFQFDDVCYVKDIESTVGIAEELSLCNTDSLISLSL
jgi:hypothetical protein